MVFPDMSWSDTAIIAVALVVLWLPGGAVAAAAGIRGWRLAAVAPLMSFAVAGLGGPWTSGLGLAWSPYALAAWSGVFTALAAVLGRLVRHAERPPAAPWSRWANYAVAVCLVVGASVSLTTTLVGVGRMNAIPRGWDAGFHANGIRWILDTGDGGLTAMSKVNWYGPVPEVSYPNAYHLVCAVVQKLSGGDIAAVLNAVTAITPGLMGLGLIALVNRFGGRAVLAGGAALLVAAAGPLVDMLWYGLLPFALGVAMIPTAVILPVDVVEASCWRARMRAGLLLALAAASLLCVHPGVLISAILFAGPAVVASWWRQRTGAGVGVLSLVAAGATAALLTSGQIVGSLSSAAGPSVDWPATLSQSEAIGQVLLFQHRAQFPQLWLAVALLLGLVGFRHLGKLRWAGFSTLIFVGLFVVAASYDTTWSLAATRPWWNDQVRLIGIAVIGLVLIGAHGLAEVHRIALVAVRQAHRTTRRIGIAHLPSRAVAAGLGALLMMFFITASNGLYLARNEAKMRNSIGEGPDSNQGPTVTALEQRGYAVLHDLVPPGEKVMNDRRDGSLWMYALEGVRPVFGHFDATNVSQDQVMLAFYLNQYDFNPQVRAAADRLDVGWVAVGRGFVTRDAVREPGLVELDRVGALKLVYANPDIKIYRLCRV